MHKRLRLVIIFSLALALMLIVFGVAYAKSIVVDGSPDDWVLADRIFVDANESGDPGDVPDAADIAGVFFTYDTTHLYFRLDMQADIDWHEIDYLAFCFDSTAEANALLGPCLADYALRLEPGRGEALLFDTSSTEVVAGVDIQVAAQLQVMEIALPLTAIDLTGAVCQSGCEVRTSIVVDASHVFSPETAPNPTPNVDWAPDTGGSGGSFIARLGSKIFLPVIRYLSAAAKAETNPLVSQLSDLRVLITWPVP